MKLAAVKRHPELSAAFMAGKWALARDHWMRDARAKPDTKQVSVIFARLAHREYLRSLAAV